MTRSVRVAIALCLGLVLILSVSVIALAGTSPGGAAFQQYCAGCHGSNGQGTAYAPNIQGESPADVVETARSGDDGMPSFSPSVISDSTLSAIGGYVAGQGHSGSAEYSGGEGHEDHTGASGSQYGGGHAHDNTGDHSTNNRHQHHEQDD